LSTTVLISSYYEETACGVLNLFDENNDDLLNSVILLARPPFYKDLDCLEMAIQGKCLNFIAMSSVQTLITNIWNAEIGAIEGFQANVKVEWLIVYFSGSTGGN
jgi:hypothetical protein